MKKAVSLVCACIMLTSTACGKADSSGSSSDSSGTKKNSSSSSSAGTSSVKEKSVISKIKDLNSSTDTSSEEKPEVKKDHIDEIVETGNIEEFSALNSYMFSYEDIGDVYSNDEINKCMQEISDIIANSGCDISISYKNMATGAQVYCNPSFEYQVCSPIKAPYVKSLLENGVDLDEEIVRDERWMDDDRTVASADPGTKYTVKELMYYALNESDNTAYYLLYKKFGWQWFNDLMNEIGGGMYLGYDWLYTKCNVMQIAKCFWDIYDYAEETDEGKMMVDMMVDGEYNYQIGQALGKKYKVAQKYGSEFEFQSFHDCAIVYADSPFVLCIYTDLYPETDDNCVIFRELAEKFDDLNRLIVS